MLTTLLVSASSRVLNAFGQNKKSIPATVAASATPTTPVSPQPGMTMRSGTVMEKKMTDDEEMTDQG